MEKKVLSCEFNMYTGCVEVKYADGDRIAINCTKVENEIARNIYSKRTELTDLQCAHNY